MGSGRPVAKKNYNGLHTVFKESHEFYVFVLLFYSEQEKEE